MSKDVQQRPAAWEGFDGGNWETNVDVRDFIQKNYTPYEGDASFLAPATEATTKLWAEVMEGIKVENRTHEPYKIDAQVVSGITSHPPLPQIRCDYRLAGCLRSRPHHRRLPPRGIVRYRFSDGRQIQPIQFAASRFGKRRESGRSYPPPRRNQRPIQSLGSNERNGCLLRLRHFRPCEKCAGSHPMDLLRLPCRR